MNAGKQMSDTVIETSASNYWREKLEGAPRIVSLPSDQPRRGAAWKSGERVEQDRVTFRLPSALREVLEDYAYSAEVDLFAVLLSAWQGLIFRYSNESDVVLGCVGVPSQMPADLYVLRNKVVAEQSFGRLVQFTGREIRASLAAGPVTFDGLLARMGEEARPEKHPIFQIALRRFVDPTTRDSHSASDLWHVGRTPCDVVLSYMDSGNEIHCDFTYLPTLFSAPYMSRMAAHFKMFLTAAIADSECAISELPLLTHDDEDQLREFNATERPHDPGITLADLFTKHMQDYPEAVAVELGEDTLTYRQLNERANTLAHALRNCGVKTGVAVAISMERSLELAVAMLGVLKAGGAYVPVDETYPESRRAYMLENSGATVLLSRGERQPAIPDGIDVQVVPVDTTTEIPAATAGNPLETNASGESLGYVIYTSGSTGKPKGIAMSQAALVNLITWQVGRPGFRSGAKTLQFSSSSFDVSFQEMFATWCSGGSIVMVPDATRRDPRGLLDYMIRYDIERIFLPFVALRGLAEAATISGKYPEKLREVYTAGEQLQVDDVVRTFFAALPKCLLENQYGPAETHVVTAFRLEDQAASWPALPSIGRPIANARVHVLDDQGVQLPIGVPGELFLGGPCLADGYVGRLDLTDERFVEHPLAPHGERLYRTGDLGRWLNDGTIDFLGRTDDQVKFRGFRIEPGEIAAVLASFPGVRQSVAMVADVEGVGIRLAAYVVPAEGTELTLSELHRYAGDNLPDYMVPSHVTIVDDFPLTPSGKIDRQALPAPSFDRRILSVTHEPPTTDEELKLAEMWQQLLGIGDIGVRDDFFELGGDSLLAVELFARIADVFNTELPLGSLAAHPTIAGLAPLVTGADTSAQWSPLVPLRTEGSLSPLFCIHGGRGNVASFPRLARELPQGRPIYALQWDGLDGHGGSQSIEEMARSYVRQVRIVAPEGPYLFAGQCIGGLIAREMTRVLQDEGESVELLLMYDTPNLYSSSYKLTKAMPAMPPALRRPANRLVGAGGNFARFLLGKRPRRQYVRVRAQALLRGGVSNSDDRQAYTEKVMVGAAWRYRVRTLVNVKTLLIHTGRSSAVGIALAGRWTDGMMGWSDEVSPEFEAHLVKGSHNGLPYKPESLRLLADALEATG